jgi:hypothetical protein
VAVSGALGAAAEVQLCVMVAPALRDQIRAAASARGVTLRALVLGALRDAGVLRGIADAELADRRAALAAAKARLWREHAAAPPPGDMQAPHRPGQARKDPGSP